MIKAEFYKGKIMENESYEIEIPAKYINVLKLFAAKKDIRYYLNGICVEFGANKETVLAATDGYRIGAFKVGNPISIESRHQFIIPNSFLNKFKPSKTLINIPFTFFYEDGVQRIKAVDGDNLQISCDAVNGRFPDYYKLAIKETNGLASKINPQFLLDLEKASKILHSSKSMYSVGLNGEGGVPICLHEDAFTGLIMPMREDKNQIPASTADWFNALSEK